MPARSASARITRAASDIMLPAKRGLQEISSALMSSKHPRTSASVAGSRGASPSVMFVRFGTSFYMPPFNHRCFLQRCPGGFRMTWAKSQSNLQALTQTWGELGATHSLSANFPLDAQTVNLYRSLDCLRHPALWKHIKEVIK